MALSNPHWPDHGVATILTSFKKPPHSGKACRRNHPFVDGNKRVAVTVTAAFLKVNGYRLEFDDVEAFSFLSGLYQTGTMRFAELDSWLRTHTTRPDQQT